MASQIGAAALAEPGAEAAEAAASAQVTTILFSRCQAIVAHAARMSLWCGVSAEASLWPLVRRGGRLLGRSVGNLESDGGVGGGVGKSHPHQHDSS